MYPYLICCFISFDINLLVAMRKFASVNFRNSDFCVCVSEILCDISLKFRSKYRLHNTVQPPKKPAKTTQNHVP